MGYGDLYHIELSKQETFLFGHNICANPMMGLALSWVRIVIITLLNPLGGISNLYMLLNLKLNGVDCGQVSLFGLA